MIMQEIWKDIEGYEGLYQVSSLGNIKSLKWCGTNKQKIMKSSFDKDGYKIIGLVKNGVRKMYKVHRLVVQEFIFNPNNYQQVNHKDENKSNNSYQNLEWCDCKYNNNYGTHTKRQSAKISKPIVQLTISGKIIKKYKSATECGRILGYEVASINRCCLGKQNTAYGYKWQYV